MSNEVNLRTFPATKSESLTMLYLQNQDLSKLTPQELVDKYDEVNKLVRKQISSKNSVQVKNY